MENTINEVDFRVLKGKFDASEIKVLLELGGGWSLIDMDDACYRQCLLNEVEAYFDETMDDLTGEPAYPADHPVRLSLLEKIRSLTDAEIAALRNIEHSPDRGGHLRSLAGLD